MHSTSKDRGFTLIELLIVVAIIAILAAIAVPNFLEAQVRAKVSRAKNDVRSIAVALESYRVDHNNYPPIAGQIRLTTPISYLSSYPKSPFNEPLITDPPVGNTSPGRRWETLPGNGRTFFYTSDTPCRPGTGGDVAGSDPLPGVLHGDGQPPNNAFTCTFCQADDFVVYMTFSQNVNADRPAYVGITRWNLKSVGPDGVDDVAFFGGSLRHLAERYDPTNGTTSIGDIVYFGPGYGFGD